MFRLILPSNSKLSIMKREHFAHFHIAGFSYYEGVLAFEKLKVGVQVSLKPDPTNSYDKNAVEIHHGAHKLGFIPRAVNREISKLLGAGIDCFESRVQWVDGETHPENQVGVIVYLVNKNAK